MHGVRRGRPTPTAGGLVLVALKALSKKRGRKRERNPLEEKVRKIDVQGKVAGLLGLSLEDGTHS